MTDLRRFHCVNCGKFMFTFKKRAMCKFCATTILHELSRLFGIPLPILTGSAVNEKYYKEYYGID